VPPELHPEMDAASEILVARNRKLLGEIIVAPAMRSRSPKALP
jgi:hypothetical protein